MKFTVDETGNGVEVVDEKTPEQIAAEAAAVEKAVADKAAADAAAAEAAKTPEQKAAEVAAAQAAKEVEDKKAAENHDVRRMKRFIQRAAEAEAKALALENVVKSIGQQSNTQNQEPQRAAFNSDIEYFQAVRVYDNRRFDERIQQERISAVQRVQAQSFAQKVAEAKKELPDYDDVISDTTAQFSPEVQEAIASSPIAGHVAYELAKDPDNADYIASLPPSQAAREIGKIEARIELSRKWNVHPVAKPSAAKPPIKPVASGGEEMVEVDESKLTDAQWMDLQRKRKKVPK